MEDTSPTWVLTTYMSGGSKDGGGGPVTTDTVLDAASAAANLRPCAIFDKVCDRAISGEGDPSLTATQYKEAYKYLLVDMSHISLHVRASEAVIDELQLDNFSIFLNVRNATLANSFKSLCVRDTEIGQCNTNQWATM